MNVRIMRLKFLWESRGDYNGNHFIYTDRLDGLGSSGKRKREDMAGLEDYLQLPDDYATRMSEPGKKRVN